MLPWVDVATGSLGQGLPIGVGMAIAGRYLDRLPYRVWVLCGDSELAEGSMWEAFEHAAHYALDNLIAIVDVNRLGQRGETMVGRRHGRARRARPRVRLARDRDRRPRRRGDRQGVRGRRGADRPADGDLRANAEGQGRGRGRGQERLARQAARRSRRRAIAELGGVRDLRLEARFPEPGEPHGSRPGPLELPRYELGEEVATRKAYGEALAARRLGARRRRRGRR